MAKTDKGVLAFLIDEKTIDWSKPVNIPDLEKVFLFIPKRSVKLFYFNGKVYCDSKKDIEKYGIKAVLEDTPIGKFWTYNSPIMELFMGARLSE